MTLSNQQLQSTTPNANMHPTQPQPDGAHPAHPYQAPQPVPTYTQTNQTAQAGTISGHPAATHLGQNQRGSSTGMTASQVAAAGIGSSMQWSIQHTGHTMTDPTTTPTILHASSIAPPATTATQPAPTPSLPFPPTPNRIMTFREIDAIQAPLSQPPPATTTTRPPKEYLLRHKRPQPQAVTDSAMIYYMVATGFLNDPAPYYLWQEDGSLIKWYKNELIKKLNVLLDLDEARRTTKAPLLKYINKDKAKQAAYTHRNLLAWWRKGLRKNILFRNHADWVGVLLQFTEELSIYELMRLITEAYHSAHSRVTVGTVTYAAPSDIATLWSAQAARRAPVAAPLPAWTVAAPPTAAPGAAVSFGAILPTAMWPTATQPAATPSLAMMYQFTSSQIPQAGTYSAAAQEQAYPGLISRNVPRGVQRTNRTASEAGSPVLQRSRIVTQPTGEASPNVTSVQSAFVLNKPGKRQAEEEVRELVRPSKIARQEEPSVPEVTEWSPPIEHKNPGKRKAEAELVREVELPKKMRTDFDGPSQPRFSRANSRDFPDLEVRGYASENSEGRFDANDLPPLDLDDVSSSENSRPVERLDGEMPPLNESAAPTFNDWSNHESSTHLSPVELWLAVLRGIKWTKDDLWADGKKYRPLPLDTGTEDLRRSLDLMVAEGEEIPPLFRDMPTPHEDDFTELARYIRFAQSDSQRHIDWRVDPFHCEVMGQRTNKYGRELLRSRNSVASQQFDDVDWFAEARAHAVMLFAKFSGETMDLTAANIDLVYAMMEEQGLFLDHSMVLRFGDHVVAPVDDRPAE